MKKILQIIVVLLITNQLTIAQTFTASLNGTFIQGISPVNNVFTFDNGTPYSSGVVFNAINGANTATLATHTDTSPSGTSYVWNGCDMG